MLLLIIVKPLLNKLKMNINYHETLKILSFHKLLLQEYQPLMEIPLDNCSKIDVFGMKYLGINNYLKIGIECLVNPTDIIINKKIKKYKNHFNKLVFAIFDDIEYDNKNIIIWRFPRTLLLKRKIEINEHKCIDCCKIFYPVYPNVKYCPHCGKEKFIITQKIKDHSFDPIQIPSKYSKFDKNPPFIVLKNPKLVKRVEDGKKF